MRSRCSPPVTPGVHFNAHHVFHNSPLLYLNVWAPLIIFCLNYICFLSVCVGGGAGAVIIFGWKNCLWQSQAVGGQKKLVLMAGVIGIIKNNKPLCLHPLCFCLCPSSSDVVQWPRRCWVKGLLGSPWPSTLVSLWESWWLCTWQGECQV